MEMNKIVLNSLVNLHHFANFATGDRILQRIRAGF